MGYEVQMKEWLRKNRNATLEEAYRAGYYQSTENWCRKETFQARRKSRPMSLKEVIDNGGTIADEFFKSLEDDKGI